MTYTQHTWATGETITAPKLNNMEEGIAGGGYDAVVRIDAFLLRDASTAVLESGSYSAMESKALSLKPTRVLVYGYAEATYSEGYPYTRTFVPFACGYNNYAADPDDHFILICLLDSAENDSGNGNLYFRYLKIFNDNTVEVESRTYRFAPALDTQA